MISTYTQRKSCPSQFVVLTTRKTERWQVEEKLPRTCLLPCCCLNGWNLFLLRYLNNISSTIQFNSTQVCKYFSRSHSCKCFSYNQQQSPTATQIFNSHNPLSDNTSLYRMNEKLELLERCDVKYSTLVLYFSTFHCNKLTTGS